MNFFLISYIFFGVVAAALLIKGFLVPQGRAEFLEAEWFPQVFTVLLPFLPVVNAAAVAAYGVWWVGEKYRRGKR